MSDNILPGTEGKQNQKTFVENQDRLNSYFEHSRQHAEKHHSVTQKFINDGQLKTMLNTKENKVEQWIFTVKSSLAIDPKNLPQNLELVVDTNSNVVFLVDTEGNILFLPKQLTKEVNRYFPSKSRSIQGIGKGVVHPIGSTDITLKLGDLNTIKHTFSILQESGNMVSLV